MHPAHAGQAVQAVLQQFGIGVQVAGDDHQHEILRSGDAVEHDHLGDGAHRLLERQGRRFGLVVDADHHEHHHPQAERTPIEGGVVARDHAIFFEALHAAPARGLREMGHLGQFSGREAGVVLQGR